MINTFTLFLHKSSLNIYNVIRYLLDRRYLEEKQFHKKIIKFNLRSFDKDITFDPKVIKFDSEYPGGFDKNIIPYMDWLFENYDIRVFCDRGFEKHYLSRKNVFIPE